MPKGNDELPMAITQSIMDSPELRKQLISLLLPPSTAVTATTTTNSRMDSEEQKEKEKNNKLDDLLMARANEIGNLLASTVGKILSERVDKLENRLEAVKNELEVARRYSRSFNIRVYGIPDSPNETPVQTQLNPLPPPWVKLEELFVTHLGLNLKHGIEFSHRLPSSIKDKPRPIIARFYSRLERQQVFSSLGKLKGKDLAVTIFDDLTPSVLVIYKRERADLKSDGTKRVISRQGKMFIQDVNVRSLQLVSK
ncbi:unnamed protein product [Didymodactylos carnosus]|uniref:Uncharacterized protein n=1 Tax=Didymodactylos carnosus TaxID=1234261 RepID=A0A814HN02_9BILA|nr:unnamed protein product [Didymodactylos carnosus]CAF3784427.1 unnamed protein product [Didymodactylos carnosus]